MRKGFTLVELLIAMAIGAIMLTTVSVISIPGTLQKNNDQKRKADLAKIAAALEQFRASNPSRDYPNGDNPSGGNSNNTYAWCGVPSGPSNANQTALTNALVPNYLTSLPTDPSGYQYAYVPWRVNGHWVTYYLCAYMETPGNQQSVSSACGNCGSTGCNYVLRGP